MEENLHTTTRTPINDDYAALIGKATYIYAYYEWTIINIIDILEPGFVSAYSRPDGRPLTSGLVVAKFDTVMKKTAFPKNSVTEEELSKCLKDFEALYPKRNSLIHAHPITLDGVQFLGYQGKSKEGALDAIWPKGSVEELIQEIDEATVYSSEVLDRLRA